MNKEQKPEVCDATKAWIDSAKAKEAVRVMLEKSQMGMIDSGTAAPKPIPVIPKPVKDSVKTKTPVQTNNKTNTKPLSKGKKSAPKKGKAGKAVMDKKQAT